jgi:hypothetical protein
MISGQREQLLQRKRIVNRRVVHEEATFLSLEIPITPLLAAQLETNKLDSSIGNVATASVVRKSSETAIPAPGLASRQVPVGLGPLKMETRRPRLRLASKGHPEIQRQTILAVGTLSHTIKSTPSI